MRGGSALVIGLWPFNPTAPAYSTKQRPENFFLRLLLSNFFCSSQRFAPESLGSRMAVPFDGFDRLLERRLIHCHQVTGFGKTAALHVLGVF